MLNVLNLGAGVQSSTLALMLARGELQPMPDIAIHADTQSDPPPVRAMVDYLAEHLPYEVRVVTAGSVADDLLAGRNSTGQPYHSPPLFIRHADDTKGQARRQCTREYKIAPIEREIRHLLGLKPRQRWPREPVVTQILGISTDEWHRMTDARRPAMRNVYPLVDAGLTRANCLAWWAANAPDDAPPIGRSACFMCPYQGATEWQTLRDDHPDLFERAVEIDAAVRHRIDGGEFYLHAARRPLTEAVDIAAAQGDLWGEECDGMCGT